MEKMRLTFLLWLMLPAFATSISIPLSMMDASVDDMYSGCTKEMDKKVKSTYFPREKNDAVYNGAWKQAENCAKEKFKLSRAKNKDLTLDHHLAICVYTAEMPNVYKPFNDAVRDSKSKYTTASFKFHALHFWLSSALEILRINKPCRVTYRRANIAFTGKVGQEIRFGSFTSTSKNPNLTDFGTETCFYVRTCLGGYIKDYSVFGKGEREVLVPPYEKFKIMEIRQGTYEKLKNCKTIYVLKNSGRLSNLNCKAAR